MADKIVHTGMRKLLRLKEENDILYCRFFFGIDDSKINDVDNFLLRDDAAIVDENVKSLHCLDFIDIDSSADALRRKIQHIAIHKTERNLFAKYCFNFETLAISAYKGVIFAGIASMLGIIPCVLLDFVNQFEFNIWYTYFPLCFLFGIIGFTYSVFNYSNVCRVGADRLEQELKDASNFIRSFTSESKPQAIQATDDINSTTRVVRIFCKDKALCTEFENVYNQLDDIATKEVDLHLDDIEAMLERQKSKSFDLDYSPIEESLPIYMRRVIDKYYTRVKEEEQTNIEVMAKCLQRE